MSSYRVVAGYGQLPRGQGTKDFGEMPSGYEVVNLTSSQSASNSCLHQLTKRFGAGVDLSINRNRNNNYLQDIGYREFTSATSGMYELDFTVNGAFVPEMSDWLEFAYMSDQSIIKKTSIFTDQSGQVISNPTDTTQGYVKNGAVVSTSPIVYADYKTYKKKFSIEVSEMPDSTTQVVGQVYKYTGETTTEAPIYVEGHFYLVEGIEEIEGVSTVITTDLGTDYTAQDSMEYHVYQYINMDGPVYFDVGYSQINKNTTNGQLNEIGVLLGCVIESVSLNYESGSDAQVKFSINAVAMNEKILTTNTYFDYNALLDYEVPLQPLVAGCISVYKNGQYEAIAQTDSQGITLNNNLTKLGNCLKLTYSGVALGALGIEMSVSTYANDPNKFMTYMYGYTQMSDGLTYDIAKQPLPINKMKIRSDNTSATLRVPTQMLDINLTDTYVGTASRTYNVDNALMDEPDLRPRKAQIVTGFVPRT